MAADEQESNTLHGFIRMVLESTAYLSRNRVCPFDELRLAPLQDGLGWEASVGEWERLRQTFEPRGVTLPTP